MIMFRSRKSQKKKLKRYVYILGLVFFILTVITFDLLIFVGKIPIAPDSKDYNTDAVVVLTGGTDRLEKGLDLLSQKMAKKLLVSGVYRGVDVRRLLKLSQRKPEELLCCIELGYNAESTRGNAEETKKWVKIENIQSLRLVTANYHMPRSLVEFKNLMPDIVIIPDAVFPKKFKRKNWWLWPGTANLIFSEYLKFVASRIYFFSRSHLSSGTI